MIAKPEKVVFETNKDVVDYITKGLPPTKKQFNAVMNALNDDEDIHEKIPGVDVIIPSTVKNDIDIDQFNEICRQVYHNRIRNRNIAIGVGSVLALGVFIGCRSHNKKCRENEED